VLTFPIRVPFWELEVMEYLGNSIIVIDYFVTMVVFIINSLRGLHMLLLYIMSMLRHEIIFFINEVFMNNL
jgi:hypothetical protein